jgi:hypothetical protein
MKKIIWIDDDLPKMSYVAKNLFPILWKEDICSQIIFVGDNYREDSKISIDDMSLDKLTNNMSNYFEAYCAKEAGRDKKTPKEVRESKKDLCPVRPSYIDKTDHDEIMKEIEDKLKENTGQDFYIGLDIRLFLHDNKLLQETMTMKLYYKWKKNKIDEKQNKYIVFLYSTFDKEDDVRIYWKENFKKYHNDINDDISIFGRDELMFHDENSHDYKDFLKLLSIKTNVQN